MTSTPACPTTLPTPLKLPGQAAAPLGPCDLTGMYLMHYAFRRDLRDLARAAARTPLDEPDTWSALQDRWARLLHHLLTHHTVEDLVLWPTLRERVGVTGAAADLALLDAMESEHGTLDPLLERITVAFVLLRTEPTESGRRALVNSLTEARESLGRHLDHEERAALPLVQRHLDAQEWERLERDHFRGRPDLGALRFQLPWMVHGLPADVVAPLAARAGVLFRVVLALSRPGFARAHRAAFAHLEAA